MRPETIRVLRRRKVFDHTFAIAGLLITLAAIGVLVVLVGLLAYQGLTRIDWQFLTSFPSRRPANAGILSAWVGSVLVLVVTAGTAIPAGIGAGVYLEEYSRKSRFATLVEINISNLASVPSIIYGLMALGLFVYFFGFQRSILTAGLTLGCLILPIVIVATREALRSIPFAIREA